MSDTSNHKPKSHTSVHHDLVTGQMHVIPAPTTPATALRLEIAKAVEEYGLQDRVEYSWCSRLKGLGSG